MHSVDERLHKNQFRTSFIKQLLTKLKKKSLSLEPLCQEWLIEESKNYATYWDEFFLADLHMNAVERHFTINKLHSTTHDFSSENIF